MGYIRTMRYYLDIKVNEILIHTTTHMILEIIMLRNNSGGFPGGAVVGSPPASAGDMGSSPGLGGSHVPWSS